MNKLLIVEDDIAFRPVWQYILERAEGAAAYDWAESVTQAEELLQKAEAAGKPYDLLVTDIFLSGARTGFDLWNLYRNKMRGKIILISSMEQQKMAKEISDPSSAPVYLKKPIVVHECIETIYEMLHKAI
jgi:response regulator of citrate/malate metabolism